MSKACAVNFVLNGIRSLPKGYEIPRDLNNLLGSVFVNIALDNRRRLKESGDVIFDYGVMNEMMPAGVFGVFMESSMLDNKISLAQKLKLLEAGVTVYGGDVWNAAVESLSSLIESVGRKMVINVWLNDLVSAEPWRFGFLLDSIAVYSEINRYDEEKLLTRDEILYETAMFMAKQDKDTVMFLVKNFGLMGQFEVNRNSRLGSLPIMFHYKLGPLVSDYVVIKKISVTDNIDGLVETMEEIQTEGPRKSENTIDPLAGFDEDDNGDDADSDE